MYIKKFKKYNLKRMKYILAINKNILHDIKTKDEHYRCGQ